MAGKAVVSRNSKSGEGTTLRPCTCRHPYQEAKYGTLRVFNYSKGNIVARCTVCGREG